jgi:hypothetical protein
VLHAAHDRDVEQQESAQRHLDQPHTLATSRTTHQPSPETKQNHCRDGVPNALRREQRRVHKRPRHRDAATDKCHRDGPSRPAQ